MCYQESIDLSLHTYPEGSIFRHSFINVDEVIYDPTHDMIGDLFGATFLLQWLKKFYPHLKVSWYIKKTNTRSGTNWFKDFNVLNWINLDIFQFYKELPKKKLILSSRKDFHVWHDLKFLNKLYNWTPKIKVNKTKQDKYVVMHILQTTKDGERSRSYVKRRALDFEKYKALALELQSKGISVIRVGAFFDRYQKIEGISDLTGSLTLNKTLNLIKDAQVFIGGDVGLKLAASAMDIPCVIEIDAKSKDIGGLGGCDSKIVKDFSLGTNKEILLSAIEAVYET